MPSSFLYSYIIFVAKAMYSLTGFLTLQLSRVIDAFPATDIRVYHMSQHTCSKAIEADNPSWVSSYSLTLASESCIYVVNICVQIGLAVTNHNQSNAYQLHPLACVQN
jgi:hypothetical protein